jgi:repressor LexA
MTDSQGDTLRRANQLNLIRKQLGMKQGKFAEILGIAQNNVTSYETGKRPIGKNIESRILRDLNVNPTWWNTGEGEIFNSTPVGTTAKIIENDSVNYENLPFISTKTRVNFMESLSVLRVRETFRVSKSNPEENYAGQIVIEIEGDSMEPNYWEGCKVRCKEAPAEDWEYLASGVYAVVYGNFFVVKRVKNSPSKGKLTLHSDNSEKGGSIEIPLSKVRKVWRVMRIVDAPAR